MPDQKTSTGKKNVFVYVGPHRSGSQFLQTFIFQHIPDLFPFVKRDHVTNDIPLELLEQHPMFADVQEARRRIDERLAKIEEPNVLFSNEDLFGDYGRHNSTGVYLSQPFYDNRERTALLNKLFPEAKIIMTPRRQDHWVASAYMHFIHNFETVDIDRFINPGQQSGPTLFGGRSNGPSLNIRALDWGAYLENFHREFGPENVLVVPHELLLTDPRAAFTRMYDFMGVEPYYPDHVPHINKSYSGSALKLALIFNRFVRTPKNPCGILPLQPFSEAIMRKRLKNDNWYWWFLAGISRRISLYWFMNEVIGGINYKKPDVLGDDRRTMILDYYADKNRRYAEMIDLDLEPFGYY
jgi:hypothetical protein